MSKKVTLPPYVVNVENPIMSLSQTIDWGLKKLNIPQIHEKGIKGKGVKIGIVDSGCNLKHSDLKIKNAYDFTKSGTPEDSSGHGTHVAGIIAAQGNNHGVLGVAPDSEISIYKALDGSNGTLSGVISAIKAAIDEGMDIINLSLGATTTDKSLENICKQAVLKGITLVVASGNSGKNEKYYPASYDFCISVGAIDETMKVAYFTTFGEHLDIVAPGANVLSTYLNNGYAVLSGTSMAAPFVAGCLALIKQHSNTITLDNLYEASIDINSPGVDIKSGHGIVNPTKIILPNTEFSDINHKSIFNFLCKKRK
jgi:subtilisin family serine protease